MAQFELWYKQDLNDAVEVQKIPGNVFQNDVNSVVIGAELTSGGTAASLSGYSVVGYLIREDGVTMVQTGTIASNKASIVIPNNALTVAGRLDIVIKLAKNSDRISVLACTGYVHRTTTDTIVVPERMVPTLDELLDEIENLENGISRQRLTSGDLNDLSPASGSRNQYYCGTSLQSLSNIPTGETGSFSLDVIDMYGYTIQRLYIYKANSNKIFQRQQYWAGSGVGRTWGAWEEIAFKNQAPIGGSTAGSLTAGSKFTINSSRIAKLGHIVFVKIIATATSAYSSSDTIATVSEGYRPSIEIPGIESGFIRGETVYQYAGYCKVTTAGVITESFTSSGQSGDVINLLLAYNTI